MMGYKPLEFWYINQSISTNHLHKNDQWLTNKVKNNKKDKT